MAATLNNGALLKVLASSSIFLQLKILDSSACSTAQTQSGLLFKGQAVFTSDRPWNCLLALKCRKREKVALLRDKSMRIMSVGGDRTEIYSEVRVPSSSW